LEPVKKLRNLPFLRLYDTGVSDCAVADVQRAMPGLKIER